MFQISVACLLAPGRNIQEAYLRLCVWDCGWYENIARRGYHSRIPPIKQDRNLSNVAFFPAYPYLGRVLHLSSGLSPSVSLLIVAQLFSVLFWATFWLLLVKWKVPRWIAAWAILAVLSHPAAFFLITGYSESLFLSSLLLFVFFTSNGVTSQRHLAALAGFAMSGTRIIGLPAAGFPILHLLFRWSKSRNLARGKRIFYPIVISGIAASGALLFLGYCQVRFGDFQLYMKTQKIGWGITPDYGALWKWQAFEFRFPIDRFATFASGGAFGLFLMVEAALGVSSSGSIGLRRRLPVYATAFLIFFVTLSGLKSVQFQSMIRYSLPWYILLILCLTQLVTNSGAAKPIVNILLVVTSLGWISLYFLFQLPHLHDFLLGLWFA